MTTKQRNAILAESYLPLLLSRRELLDLHGRGHLIFGLPMRGVKAELKKLKKELVGSRKARGRKC